MTTFHIPLSTLRAALTHVAGDNDVRDYLRGVFVDFRKRRIVATDGHRLFTCEGPHADAPPIILPAIFVNSISKSFTGGYARGKMLGNTSVTFSLDGRTVMATLGGVTLTDQLRDGTFPNVDKVIPTEVSAILPSAINALYLADAGEALAIYRNLPKKGEPMVVVHTQGDNVAVVSDGQTGALVIIMPMRSGGVPANGAAQAALDWYNADSPKAGQRQTTRKVA